MIGASRRRSAIGRRLTGETFDLHLREARSAVWHRRLLHASVAALVAAAALFWLPVGLPARALITAGAALAAAAWPRRDGVADALATIRGQTGLSYETALAVGAREGGGVEAAYPDPYGFHAQVVERARSRVREYERAARPAWWLPALVMAAALLALPELAPEVVPSFARPTPAASGAAPEVPAAEGGAPEPAPPEPPAPGRADAPAAAGQEQDEEAPPVSEPPEGGGTGAAPLSRYLESLRERPAQTSGAPTDSAGADESEPQRERQSGEAAGEPNEAANQAGGERSAGQSESQRAAQGEGQPGGAETEPAAAPGGAEEGAEGQAGQQQQQEGDSSQEGQAEATEPGGETESGMGAGGERLEEGAEGAGGEGDQQGQSAGGAGEPGQGEEGSDSAGLGGGAAVEGSFELPGTGTGGPQEQLRGVLQEGPENVAGSVRLPGSDAVQLPPGTAHAPYQSAAEEALSEGDLPLDYQEIIRRYFR